MLTYINPVASKMVAKTSQREGINITHGETFFLSELSRFAHSMKGRHIAIPAKRQNTWKLFLVLYTWDDGSVRFFHRVPDSFVSFGIFLREYKGSLRKELEKKRVATFYLGLFIF